MIGASLADEPRHQRSQERQPNAPQHNVSTTVKISIFFMTRTPIDTESFHRRAPARRNSTPPSAMSKRNIVVFRQQFPAGLVERSGRRACARYANGIAAPAATRRSASRRKLICASSRRTAREPQARHVDQRIFPSALMLSYVCSAAGESRVGRGNRLRSSYRLCCIALACSRSSHWPNRWQ